MNTNITFSYNWALQFLSSAVYMIHFLSVHGLWLAVNVFIVYQLEKPLLYRY